MISVGWDWGIGATWSSSPHSWTNYPQKNNRVRNCNAGLKIYRLSYPVFGYGPPNSQMSNSIYNNGKNVSIGTSYPEYSSGTYAYANWWGSASPNTSLFQVGTNAYFYYTPGHLTSDPWAGIPKMLAGNDADSSIQIAVSDQGSIDPLYKGIELRDQNKYKEAKDFFVSYIAEYPNNQAAYVELYNCYNKETADDLIKFFTILPRQASADHKLLLSNMYLKQDNVKEAKEVNNNIIADNPNTSLEIKAKLNKVYIALYNEDNINEAIAIFNEALSNVELSTPIELSLVHQAIVSYANMHGKETTGLPALSEFITPEEETAEQEISDKYSLLGNYPNPFNPSTTISYSLPYHSSVELTIFDVLGREIRSYKIISQSAGKQSIFWDGKNSNGKDISSGIYFYRLKLKSLENNEEFVKTSKLIMLK